ncbi:MAG TPA: class I SAM-dependent methyltransferase [Pyrinomonadaceae bacterium]|jgi:2-polyprenyl-3-methyl-5-hydroxy-6-metoxy-1,4-benzoquinol methylase
MTESPVKEREREVNRELEAAIDPWLEHMRWRADFAEWRERRLWQENKQQATLGHLRSFLRLAGQLNGNGHAPDAPAPDALRGRLILDLGCGMGGLTTALALAGASVQPLDFNPHYCRITRLRGSRHGLRLSPVNAAGEHLPFADGRFDLIVCMDVLEHVSDPEKLISEISRCLKPGGLCQLTAVNRFAFRDPHYHVRFVNWLPRRLANPYLRLVGRSKDNARSSDRQALREMHYYRYGQLTKLFARHGLAHVAESGELKLKKRLAGWRRLLQRGRLLGPAYKTYRACCKSTYLVLAVKEEA